MKAPAVATAPVRISLIQIGEITSFDLVTPQGARIPLETQQLGLHNVENIVGAAALLMERGLIDAAALQRGAASFRGVARRLDKKTSVSRLPAYEGFGSSYEKARSAIDAMTCSESPRIRRLVHGPLCS